MPDVPETPLLRFRRYRRDDADHLFRVFADPYARRFYPRMADPANILKWIEWNLNNYETFGFGLWALEDSAGRFLGDCGLTYQEVEGHQELEIGYHIIEDERGKGYATEAARACLAHGFTQTPALLICSIVDPQNAASVAVASRIHTSRRDLIRRNETLLLFYTIRDEGSVRAAEHGDGRTPGWTSS